MRKCLLLIAAFPLIVTPPALAGSDQQNDKTDQAHSVCRSPEIDHSYATDRMAVHVKLPASGCPAREHSLFYVSAAITRSDVFGPQASVWRSVRCGPFRSSADREADEAASEYFCELDVALEHPEAETNDYEVEVTFPGATEDRTVILSLTCTSDGRSAVCDKQAA